MSNGWNESGFMGAPPSSPAAPQQAPAPAPAPAPGQVQEPQPPIIEGKPYHRFEIPKSVVANSLHWKGQDSDLIFGMREPTGGDAHRLAADKTNFEEAVPGFIVQIGDVPVSDYTQAKVWYKTVLTPKAQNLVTQAFLRMVIPSDDEGESLLASRTQVG